MISAETVDKILSTAQIEEVVGDFVKLKRRGANLLGNCPFHNEKTPSFTVSPTKGIFKCFGCGKAGNSVGFIMEHEQLSYPEALRFLAQKYQIEIEETGIKESVEEKTDRESLYILLSAAQKYYTQLLTDDEEGKTIAQPYIKERQIKPEIAKTFELGWSHSGRENFSNWAIKNGYNRDFLVRTGLAFETEQGGLMDRFRERLMFPIHNLSGKVVGFGGRILRSTGKEAKYINSPETEIYNKSRIVYGLFQAKKAIRQHDVAILVEGYMDVLSLHQSGIENTVAVSGTSLTEEQLRQIKRFSDNLILLFDGDAAGQKAALRAIDLALAQEMNPKIVTLPPEHDPDSFAKSNDAEDITKYLNDNAKDFVQFRVGLLTDAEKNDPVQKSKISKELLQSLLLVNDNLRRAFHIKDIEKMLGLDEKLLYDELRRLQINRHREDKNLPDYNITETPAPKQIEVTKINTTGAQEKQLIKTLLLYGDRPFNDEISVGQYILSELNDIEWDSAECKALAEYYATVMLENNDVAPDFQRLLLTDDKEKQQLITGLIADNYELSDNWKKFLGRPITTPDQNFSEEIHSALMHFKLRKVLRMIQENEKDLKVATDENEVNELLAVHMHLTELKKKIASELGVAVL